MRGAVLHAPRDVRLEQLDDPQIVEPTDAVLRLSATCVCGSDLWPYRGANEVTEPRPIGHEYCGVAEEVGSEEGGMHRFRADVGELVLIGLAGEAPNRYLAIESWHPGRGVTTRRRD